MSDVLYAAILHGKKPHRFAPGKGKRFKGGDRKHPLINFSTDKNKNKDIVGVDDSDIILDDPFMLKLFDSKAFTVWNREVLFEFEKNDQGKYVATGIPFSESATAWLDDICYLHMFDDFSPLELLALDFRKSVGSYRKETMSNFNFGIGFHSDYYQEDLSTEDYAEREGEEFEKRVERLSQSFFNFWKPFISKEVWENVPSRDLYIYSTTKPELSLYHIIMKANPVISPELEKHMFLVTFHTAVHWYKMATEYHAAKVLGLDDLICGIRTANTRFSKFINDNIIDIQNYWESVDHKSSVYGGRLEDAPDSDKDWYISACLSHEPFIPTLLKGFIQ